MTRYPLAPLAALVGVELSELGRLAGVSGSTWKEYRNEGVSERVADRLASRFGFHPAVVWPGWMAESTAKASRVCVECDALFVPTRRNHRYCSPACRGRAWQRDRYQRDPVFRESKRAAARAYGASVDRSRENRAYYDRTAEAQRAASRAYYQANAERIRARRRERYHQDPAADIAANRAYKERRKRAEQRKAS